MATNHLCQRHRRPAVASRPRTRPGEQPDTEYLCDLCLAEDRMRSGFGPSSYPNYVDARQRSTTLEGVYAYSRFPRAMSLGGVGTDVGSESVFGSLVTVNYFTVLGVVPAAGRLLSTADGEQPWASPVAVLSHRFWTRRFNRDPTIVGRHVTLNGHPFVVVGVASEGFHGTGVRALDLWVPTNMTVAVTSPGTTALTDRAAGWLLIGGRLKPGISLAQAAAEMEWVVAAVSAILRAAATSLTGAAPASRQLRAEC